MIVAIEPQSVGSQLQAIQTVKEYDYMQPAMQSRDTLCREEYRVN